MGYVLDALNRAPDGRPDRPKRSGDADAPQDTAHQDAAAHAPPSALPPAPPTPDDGPVEPANEQGPFDAEIDGSTVPDDMIAAPPPVTEEPAPADGAEGAPTTSGAPAEAASDGEAAAQADDATDDETLTDAQRHARADRPDDDPSATDSPDIDNLPDDDVQVVQLGQVDDRLVALVEPASVMAEEYRSVRTSILANWKQKRHLLHTITSATPQEGKTITSLNLGLSFAELRNRRTIVVEADLRLPQFANLFGIKPARGLVSHLDGTDDLSNVIYRVDKTNLHVIPAGRRANDRAVQLLSSTAMVRVLEKLQKHYDHVIIDTPPVAELADAGILGALSNDVLLIARIGRTPRKLIELAIRTLASYNAPVAGLIATDQKHYRRHYYYKYGYRYSYRYYTQPRRD